MRPFITSVLFLMCPFASVDAHEGHSAKDSRHHWEIASPDPDRIFLTFLGDASTSRAVSWRTDGTVKKAYAEIAVATDSASFAQFSQRVPAVTEPLDLTLFSGNPPSEPVHYHSAAFENLQPATPYVYRVGDGGGHWSEWIQFTTASATAQPFSFTYFGDAQNDLLKYWSRLIRVAYQTAPDASFAIHAGDLVNRAHSDLEWAEWFKAGGFIHSQWTGVPVTGNHEYKNLPSVDESVSVSMQWRPQFRLPIVENLPDSLHETVYSFDYQRMQFIVLNSNNSIEEQTPYLEQELRKPGYRWRCVSYHHSIFSPQGRFTETYKQMLAGWVPLFEEYNVDLVLQGHDHCYVRSQMPARSSQVDQAGAFQTMYVTSVSGPKQYDIKDGQLESHVEQRGLQSTRVGEHTQLFQVIGVDGNRLRYRAYTATGKLYDDVTIVKNLEDGTKTLIEAVPNVPTRTFENTEPYTFIKERKALQDRSKAATE